MHVPAVAHRAELTRHGAWPRVLCLFAGDVPRHVDSASSRHAIFVRFLAYDDLLGRGEPWASTRMLRSRPPHESHCGHCWIRSRKYTCMSTARSSSNNISLTRPDRDQHLRLHRPPSLVTNSTGESRSAFCPQACYVHVTSHTKRKQMSTKLMWCTRR
jgi:hypothetical protein